MLPRRTVHAGGAAGAIVSNDVELLEKARMLANHGRLEKYTHKMEGVNSRLDGLQAAILRVKLRHLDDWNESRRRLADYYMERLTFPDLILPVVHESAQ